MAYEENINSALGKIIRRRRKELSISQERLAALSELHRTYISQIERGIKSPTIKTFFILAESLDIKPHELVDELERMLDVRKK